MKEITLDFETYYDKDFTLKKLTTVEYVTDDRFKIHGVGVAVNDQDPEYFTGSDIEPALRTLFDEPCLLICQNTKFDGFILHHCYNIHPTRYADTRSMSKALYPIESASLKDLAERLFPDDENMRKGDELADSKGVETLEGELAQSIEGYCKQDVLLTRACFQAMKPHFPPSEMDLISLTTRLFCEPKFTLDQARVANHLEGVQQERTEKIENGLAYINTELEEANDDPTQLSSNKQFAAIIEKMGLSIPFKVSPATGRPTYALGKADFGFQELVKNNPQHNALWTARKAIKSTGEVTRSERLLLIANRCAGRLPVALNYYGAHTGRYSGGEKTNFQNLKRGGELRKALCAPEGQFVYVADSSNIEARMLAWLADQRTMLDVFYAKGDVYIDFAQKIYNRDLNKKDNPNERFLGKCAVLGLGYGMGHNKFQDTLKVGMMGPPVDFSQQEAQRVVRLYRETNAMIVAFWRRCDRALIAMMDKRAKHAFGPMVVEHQKIRLPNGMYLRYPDLRYEGREIVFGRGRHKTKIYGGKLTENITQALARIVVTDQMLTADNYLKEKQGGIVLQVHDELVGVANTEDADDTQNMLYQIMKTPPTWAPDLPLDAEGGFANNYSK